MTTKTYRPGELIFSSSPFVHVLSGKERGKRCDQCFNRHVNSKHHLVRCSACKFARYCNSHCQKEAWKIHKLECACLVRSAPNIPTESVRLFFRLVTKLCKYDGFKETEKVFGFERNFSSLMSHIENIKSDKTRLEEATNLLRTVAAFAGDDLDFLSPAEAMECFGKMVTNSFSICDAEMQAIGVGLYLGASVLDHSCSPNAVAVFEGTTVNIRCLEPVNITENVKPTNVTISYIDQLATTECRQTQLSSQYYFRCTCERCTTADLDLEMTSSLCPRENFEGAVLHRESESPLCPSCGKIEFSASYLEEATPNQTKLRALIDQMKKLQKQNEYERLLHECESQIPESIRILSTTNLYVIQLHDLAFDACIQLQLWEKAAVYGKVVQQGFRKYYHNYHPTLGVLLMKIGKILLHLHQLTESLTVLQQADDILKVTHGKNHQLCQDLQDLLMQCTEELRGQLL